MRYVALATDYDGTLAQDGLVAPPTIVALERLRASGRKLLLVTGRRLDDLATVFDRLDLFDIAVLENGAVLHNPSTGELTLLAEPPPRALLDRLRELAVPFFAGQSIVATWEPHDVTAVKAIRDLGLELEVIFNKGSVMVLPTGVNKATGLSKALAALGVDAYNVVGVGDAENDHAFLAACAVGVAVANALPALKERADFVTDGARGAGVEELIAALVQDDLCGWEAQRGRHTGAVEAH